VNRFDYQQWAAKARAKRGNELPQARLTPEAVRAIRRNVQGKTAAQLAQEYGVHFRTVEKVRAYESWTHV
jgi:FixJ family two-component response regulator